MLAEMPVAQVSLNELSRRVGLAKSNVLRYFESREAVLLDLLDAAQQEWLAAARRGTRRAAHGGRRRPARTRTSGATLVAAVLAASLTARPVLCDLVSAQAAVLERNVSPQVAAQYKRAAIVANVVRLCRARRARVPASSGDARRPALRGCRRSWSPGRAVDRTPSPSAAMLAAYEADPSLAALRLDFPEVLRQTLEVVLSGLLVRRLR